MEWSSVYSPQQLGDFVRKRRRERGVSQSEFAETIGVSHATLSALENGKPVSSATLMRAVSFLGLNLVVVPKTTQTTVVLARNTDVEGKGKP